MNKHNMEIIIHDSYKFCEIQEEFSKHFPYLKLQFFDFGVERKGIFSRKNLITDTNKTLGDARHVHYTGHISINGHQKVSTLEQHFREIYGINIQVFRKSGNSWQTITTDNWTLTKQNKKGEEMSKQPEPEINADYDQYHEQL